MAALQWAMVEADLDPVRGSEQRGFRPVLIVSNETFNQVMPNVTVLPVTSTVRRLYPYEVSIRRGVAGQPLDSIIMAHQIRTISKQRIEAHLGYLQDPSLREDVRQAVRRYLDLD
jgi:mRNA interferase MazF